MPNLNDKLIRSLPLPKEKHKIYWDDKIVGFGLRITNNDSKSFVLRYVINGRERKYTIGGYPELNCGSARDLATKIKGEIINGIDPLDEKKEKYNNRTTLKEFSSDYIDRKKSELRNKSYSEYKSYLANHILPRLGSMELGAITKRDIEKFHSSFFDKPIMGNRLIIFLRSMFNAAISYDLIYKNPTLAIKKFPEEKRERYYSDEEINKIMNALETEKCQLNVNIIKLILLTGSRKSEVFSARWKDFDFENGVWVKPASLTKQKKSSHIPLNINAIKIIEEMKTNILSEAKALETKEEIVSNEDYLFYNPKTKTHVKDIKRFWQKVRNKAGLKDAHVHDLRHTFASVLVNNGVGLEVIGKLIGHSSIRTTQRYSHLANDSLKKATDIFAKKITS